MRTLDAVEFRKKMFTLIVDGMDVLESKDVQTSVDLQAIEMLCKVHAAACLELSYFRLEAGHTHLHDALLEKLYSIDQAFNSSTIVKARVHEARQIVHKLKGMVQP